MTELIARSGEWLLQAAALPDTLVMKTVTAERGWFETVTGIASSIMTLTLVVLAIFLAPAAWSFWRTFRKVRTIIDRVYADITPITHHASSIADNLDYITTSIRTDVQQVNATIASANRRLHQAVELTETRLNEFNALLQVVQQEAEQAFVSTASAVRGVRTGAATLSGLNETFEEDGAGGEYDYGDDDDSDGDSDEIGERGTGGDERIGHAPGRAGGTARPRLRARRKLE